MKRAQIWLRGCETNTFVCKTLRAIVPVFPDFLGLASDMRRKSRLKSSVLKTLHKKGGVPFAKCGRQLEWVSAGRNRLVPYNESEHRTPSRSHGSQRLSDYRSESSQRVAGSHCMARSR